MSDKDDGKTIAFSDLSRTKDEPSGSVKAPLGKLVCIDASQVDGSLPEGGVIKLTPGADQTIGRGEGCTYRIPSQRLSRQHARVFAGLGGWGIEDLNSTNGIQVNGTRLKSAWLKDGDEIRFGPIVFRVELETPAGDAAPAPKAKPAAGGDDRTMMIGSLDASRAVIDAMVRSVDTPAEDNPSPVVRAPTKRVEPDVREGGGRKLVLIVTSLLVLVAIGAGGVIYYPIWQRGKEIAAVVETGSSVVKQVILRARDAGAAHSTDARFKEEIAALSPILARIQLYIDSASENVELADLYAKVSILIFERDFAMLYEDGKLEEAKRQAGNLNKELSAISAKLSSVATGTQRMSVVAAADLSKMAADMVTMSEFAHRFPQVSALAPAKPTMADVNALDQDRDEFVRLRRLHNKTLSVDHPLLNAIVSGVENNDLTLINRWKQFLVTGGG